MTLRDMRTTLQKRVQQAFRTLRFRLPILYGDGMTETPASEIDALPFEKALQELEQIVAQLERGDVPLEKSIEIYERGSRLKAHCEALLRKAELKVEVITQGADGKAAGAKPLDVG